MSQFSRFFKVVARSGGYTDTLSELQTSLRTRIREGVLLGIDSNVGSAGVQD